jgi:hypothetical protein
VSMSSALSNTRLKTLDRITPGTQPTSPQTSSSASLGFTDYSQVDMLGVRY